MTTPQDTACFWDRIASHGERIALSTGTATVTYAELAAAADAWVEAARGRLPSGVARPLVMIEMAPVVEVLVAYLGCLRARWPILVTAPTHGHDTPRREHPPRENPLIATYGPTLIVRHGGSSPTTLRAEAGGSVEDTAAPEMLAELALLLSTSGTTGAQKLVRLSAGNLEANAASIAAYLELTPQDVAPTTLPLHYSYGISVLHSYLMVGARLVLTDAPLTDERFWSAARSGGATSLALVPTQFDLLERTGFEESWLPSLRYVTQAGGRLDPSVGRRFATRAEQHGWSLFIMYGQTEASPRMAYLPPGDALAHGDTIGRPVPGGRFSLVASDGREIEGSGETGELVYEGPNVMLGYATDRAGLAAPPMPPRLHTGDLAERLDNGYFRITGRKSRFIKPFGLRVALDEVEASLRAQGVAGYASGNDEGLVVFVPPGSDPDRLRDALAERYGLPRHTVVAHVLEEVPTLSSGKVDYRGLSTLAAEILEAAGEGDQGEALDAALTRILRTPDLDLRSSFVDHGGDSLAYLEMQLFLSRRFGVAPDGWEQVRLGELARFCTAAAGAATTGGADATRQQIKPDLILRLLAISAVVLLHVTSGPFGGGAFLLTILVGVSLARFHRPALLAGRSLHVLRSMLLPLLASYYVVLLVIDLRFDVPLAWYMLRANQIPAPPPPVCLPYWFVSNYTQCLLIVCLALVLPPVRAALQRWRFSTPLAVTVCLSVCLALLPTTPAFYGDRVRLPLGGLQLISLGWCLAEARTGRHLALAALATLATYALAWRDADPTVTGFLLLGPALLLYGKSLSVPTRVARALFMFGGLTLYLYLAHSPVFYVIFHFIVVRKVSDFFVWGPRVWIPGFVLTFVVAVGLKRFADFMFDSPWGLVSLSTRAYRRVMATSASPNADA